LGLDAPSWRHHNATVAVALTGEFDVVSSRGFLQQAEQRQWADYICLKDNAVLRHICWAQLHSVVVLQSPCPHTLKDRRWTAFSSVATVSEEDVDRIFSEIVEHDGAERAVGDIVSDWTRDRPKDGLQFVRRTVHPEFLQLLCAGACEHIPIWHDPNVKARGLEIARRLGIEPEQIQALSNPDDVVPPLPVSLCSSLFANAAARIRGHPEDEEGGAEPEHRVLEWLDKMAEQSQFGLEHLRRSQQVGISRTSPYNFECLLQALRIASMMKNDDKLMKMMVSVGEFLWLPQGFLRETASLPSAQTLSRHRLTLDAAFQLCCQNRLQSWMKEGQQFTASLLFDSSPRNGREWMFGEAYIVKDIDLEAFVSLVDRMEAMRAGLSQQLRCDLSDEFEKMTEQLRRFMWHLVFPPACLGARNHGLAAKYAACLHKVRLLMGEWLFTQTFMRYVINLCTDVGTESDFALVPTIDGNQMFPQWDERRLVDDNDDSFMCPGWDSSALVSFAQALHSPGVEHCCHNVEKKLAHGLSFWNVFYKGAKEVAKLLHGKYYKQRFCDECLKSESAEGMLQQVKRFSWTLYEARFGSVALWSSYVLPLRKGFAAFYRETAFPKEQKSGAPDAAPAQGEDDKILDVSLLSSTLASSKWWAQCAVNLALQIGVERLRILSRACPCHADVPKEFDSLVQAYRHYEKTYRRGLRSTTCPAAGLMAHYFAVGEPIKRMRSWYKHMQTLLLQELLDLDVVDRDALMQEFEKGCDHVIYLVEVEFSVWSRLPLHVCALGHPEVSVARQAMRVCRAMFNELEPALQGEVHEVVLSMFSDKGDLFVEMNAFLDSQVPLCDLPALRWKSFKFRLVRCNEISVERLHALATSEGTRVGNISPATVSTTLREPCMWHPVWGFEMHEMAAAAAKVCNDVLVISTFNFQRHPAVTTYRDMLLARPAGSRRTHSSCANVGRECFYHCDSFSVRARHIEVEVAITEHKARLTELLQHRQAVQLLEEAKEKDAPERLKVEALCTQYAFKHFKDKRLTCLVSVRR
jgi:hypothetical protein